MSSAFVRVHLEGSKSTSSHIHGFDEMKAQYVINPFMQLHAKKEDMHTIMSHYVRAQHN